LKRIGVSDSTGLLRITYKHLDNAWDFIRDTNVEIMAFKSRVREQMQEQIFEKGSSATEYKKISFNEAFDRLPTRAQNVLKRLGVRDADGLLRVTRKDLIHVWDYTKKINNEILNLQIRLRLLRDQQSVESNSFETTHKTLTREDKSNSYEPQYKGSFSEVYETRKEDEGVSSPLLNKLSMRARNVIRHLGVKDVPSLLNVTRNEILNVKGCGKVTALEIRTLQFRLKQQF